jgi:hypothetical protein
LYVNGTLVRTRAVTGNITTSADLLRIGGNAVWDEYFNGLIDEVRIYNRALSVSEIQTDMNTPVLPPVILPGDYNADDIVDSADYVVWRKNLGSSVNLPNDTTPGTVTAAYFTVWKANFGATAGQGQHAAGGGTIVGSYPVSSAAVSEDAVSAPLSGLTPSPTVESGVAKPNLRQRQILRSHEFRDEAPRRSATDSLLLAHLKTLAKPARTDSSSPASEDDADETKTDAADISFFKTIDDVFAELGRRRALRRRAR